MKKTNKNKLLVSTEKLRELDGGQLTAVAGGQKCGATATACTQNCTKSTI